MVKFLNMNELPQEFTRKNKKYKLVKVYERYARYIDNKGNTECFTFADLGIHTYQLTKGERRQQCVHRL